MPIPILTDQTQPRVGRSRGLMIIKVKRDLVNESRKVIEGHAENWLDSRYHVVSLIPSKFYFKPPSLPPNYLPRAQSLLFPSKKIRDVLSRPPSSI
jgi:hypothetical protein